MRSLSLLLLLLPSALAVRLAPLVTPTHADLIDGEYIVNLFGDHTALTSHFDAMGINEDQVLQTYQSGYAAQLSSEQVERVRMREEVDFVEQNSIVHLDYRFENNAKKDVQKNPPSWGLKRIDQRDLPLEDQYVYPSSAGEGVDVYVIDTGIFISHNDFEGRAKWGITVPRGASDSDGNGHGTHVASTIVGKKYGVAKKATVYAVKVLNDNGSGTMADVIKGIDWVSQRSQSRKNKKVTANMSLGGGKSPSLDNAVERSVASGVHYAVAAGNSNADACNYSPAGAPSPVTVGATSKDDSRAYFSNYGRCVDLFAPGQDITGAWIGSDNAERTISGTSMASPHVCGVLTLALASHTFSPKDLKSHLIDAATSGRLGNLPRATVNKLLYIPDHDDDNNNGIGGGVFGKWRVVGERVF